MLDVHAPHEKIHGFRDFLLHLLTITIGLLIAVGIEGCVESVHHRHLRNEADANLRQELRDNEKEVANARKAIVTEQANLVSVLKFLDARSAGKAADPHSITLDFRMGSLTSASWRTASATGVLSYMEYDRVQRYATAYQLQDEYSRLQTETLDQFLQLLSYFAMGFDPDKVTAAEARTEAAEVRKALSHLVAMDQIGGGLTRGYEKALTP